MLGAGGHGDDDDDHRTRVVVELKHWWPVDGVKLGKRLSQVVSSEMC